MYVVSGVVVARTKDYWLEVSFQSIGDGSAKIVNSKQVLGVLVGTKFLPSHLPTLSNFFKI